MLQASDGTPESRSRLHVTRSRSRNLENFDLGARIDAMAASMLEGVDREECNLSEADVMFALTRAPVILRINSDSEMGELSPGSMTFVVLWNSVNFMPRHESGRAAGPSCHSERIPESREPDA